MRFISVSTCAITLEAVRQAIGDGVEFCVCDKQHCIPNELSTADNTYFQSMSSGSDGKPKRIRRSHLSWLRSFDITIANAKLEAHDSYAIIGKLSHSLSLYAALEAAWLGADIHALTELRADKQYDAIHQLKSSVLYATPTQLRMLCNNDIKRLEPNLHLHHIFCGGGKLDKTTYAQLTQNFPKASIREFYGASETSFITISDANTPIESVGRAYPGVQLKVLKNRIENSKCNNADSNSSPNTSPIGEIWVKSPYLFKDYAAGSSNETQWQDGFLSVGELGYLDDNGYLFLSGRRSRMVNIADKMAFPEHVESFLNKQSSIKHCAVIAVPNEKRGASFLAIAQTQSNVDDNDDLKQALLKLCRQNLGATISPKNIVFVDELPMLASGKPDLQTINGQHQPS